MACLATEPDRHGMAVVFASLSPEFPLHSHSLGRAGNMFPRCNLAVEYGELFAAQLD